jgi:NAD(P)-dependent dehydrogenase (short-subunit alcohol dehydrogenase family)
MEKRTILIIGSSGGLGSELVKSFDETKYNLALHYYSNPVLIESKSYKAYQADITIETEVEALVKKVVADFGSVDIVLNNAGVTISEMSWKTGLPNWEKTLAINLTGPFLVTKHVLPHMRQNKFGRIVYMSSIVAQTGHVGASAYAASKSGLFGLVKTISKEVANKGITINAVALGYFNAGMIEDVPEKMQEELKQAIPVSALGKPEELSELIKYIISEKSSYLTGQTINLNGGLYV